MERHRRLLVLMLAVAVAVPIYIRSRPGREQPAPAAFSVPASRHGYVQIRGDVRHPGIYPLGAKTMTYDVILMAEPLRPFTITEPAAAGSGVPTTGESLQVAVRANGVAVVSRGGIPVSERLILGIPLDINTVSEADLDKVPGIGPGMAGRIVQHRHKNGGRMSVEELLQVEGIGEKKFAGLQKYF